MAYSQTGIVNLGLGKVGIARIANLNEDSPSAIRAHQVWDYVLDEVLEAKDWRFAKTRKALAKSTTVPVSGWSYAYPLPADFLRLCKGTPSDPVVYPSGYPWVVEALESGLLALLSNFDDSSESLVVQYIRRISDVTKFSASFANTLAWRIGAEVAIIKTEAQGKFEFAMKGYAAALKRAEGITQGLDYVEGEEGSTSWADSGRDLGRGDYGTRYPTAE